jgi:hypothetical protein
MGLAPLAEGDDTDRTGETPASMVWWAAATTISANFGGGQSRWLDWTRGPGVGFGAVGFDRVVSEREELPVHAMQVIDGALVAV